MAGGFRGAGVRPRDPSYARTWPGPLPARLVDLVARAEDAVAQPLVGITTDGQARAGLFSLTSTGVSTVPIKEAAEAFLATLSESQRPTAMHRIESPEWRKWLNAEFCVLRHGALLESMDADQRERALGLVRASLSARGFETTRAAMKLNEVLREITGNSDALGEWLYFLSIFGTPSMDQPWGWQLDGHHLVLNCFVLGDQVVTTPAFVGAEPCIADDGPYQGTRVFDLEQERGLALIRALSPGQREQAIIFKSILNKDLPPERKLRGDWRQWTGAFKDNAVIPYEGARADAFSTGQRGLLLDLVEAYVGLMDPGHAAVKMEEVRRHLDETHFAWIGKFDDETPFYYKVHSPVIIVEFDQHAGVFLDNDEAWRYHSHAIVRTPNGNDYGKDLLRQHYERYHQ